MTKKHYQGWVSQKALIERDGKYLLVRDRRGRYELPGGRIDQGEVDLQTALKRELREELGAEAEIGQPLLAFIDLDSQPQPTYTIIYKATIPPDVAVVPDEAEVTGTVWITASEIESLDVYPGMKLALSECLSLLN